MVSHPGAYFWSSYSSNAAGKTNLKAQFQSDIAIFELTSYLIVAVICLRCLKAFGLDLKIDDKNYEANIFDDLVFRYAAYRFSNFLTIFLTLIFVALVVFSPPIKIG